MALFKGLSAFPITPADADGRVDTAALRGLVRRLVEAEVDSIGLLGSTGTYPYLTRDERRRAIDAAVAEADGRVPVMVGIGALRTDEAAALGRGAKAAGADAALLAPVSYIPLSDEEVFTHFETVAAETALPLCIYNNPGVTNFTFSPALIGRLASLPYVAAVKNPSPEASDAAAAVADLRARVPADFAIGYSADLRATEALLAGGDGWYSVLAGLFPAPCVAIRRAVAAGDADEARRLNAALAPVWRLLTAHTGLRTMYAAANRMKLCEAQPPRPLLPLSAEVQAEAFATLIGLGLMDKTWA